MKRSNRILLGAGCFILIIVSWIVAVRAQTGAEKQLQLMAQAAALIKDEIYINAVPLLEQAASYDAEHTHAAEEELKKVYLVLIDQRGYHRRYLNLLEKQMGRRDVRSEVFAEAASYYLSISRLQDALLTLRSGIDKTGCDSLIEMYENNRYEYEISRTVYEYAASIHGGTAQVKIDGLWGLARADGSLMIPCQYDMISTFSADRAIVMQDSEVFAVNRDNMRVAKLHENAAAFGNLADNRIPVFIDNIWRRATGDFVLGSAVFEQLGMYSGGYAAAKSDGKWGVIDLETNWLLPPEYDEIILDEIGRCYARGAVFARKGHTVYLYVNGKRTDKAYENAKPFSNEGFAAVKNNGRWGFIDINGDLAIDYVFEQALSFGQHLAAVKSGDFWGYVNQFGQIVIQPVFIEAKSFSNGSAPVLTERGWQFITLIEYMRGANLSL